MPCDLKASQEGESLDPMFTGQGTRLSEKAPWETYAQEMETQMSPEIAAAVAEYVERSYDAPASNQTKEELHRQKELSDETAKEYQWLKKHEYEDVEQRIGMVMHAATFLNKLQDAGIHCWYAAHPHPDKCILFVARDGIGDPENVCWVQMGYMPELSIVRFDEHDVVVDERRRGWRTCLLQLILKGIITEEKAIKLFGPPGQTDAFARYNRTLFEWRSRRFTVA
jgi:hypothetical protein